MIYIAGAVVALIIWFWIAKRKGDNHAGRVYQMTVDQLSSAGVPQGAIKAFTMSVAFATIAKGSFGKQVPVIAADEAVAAFYANEVRYRELGVKFNGDAH